MSMIVSRQTPNDMQLLAILNPSETIKQDRVALEAADNGCGFNYYFLNAAGELEPTDSDNFMFYAGYYFGWDRGIRPYDEREANNSAGRQGVADGQQSNPR